MQKLVHHDIVLSFKGPRGGFSISRAQSQLPILRIVEAIDGLGVFSECSLGLTRCSVTLPCPFHDEYVAVRDGFMHICKNNCIEQLYNKVTTGMAFLAR